MDILSPEKLILVLAIALVVLGPKKLPEVAKSLGRGLQEFRRASDSLRDEVKSAFDPDAPAEEPKDVEGGTHAGPAGS